MSVALGSDRPVVDGTQLVKSLDQTLKTCETGVKGATRHLPLFSINNSPPTSPDELPPASLSILIPNPTTTSVPPLPSAPAAAPFPDISRAQSPPHLSLPLPSTLGKIRTRPKSAPTEGSGYTRAAGTDLTDSTSIPGDSSLPTTPVSGRPQLITRNSGRSARSNTTTGSSVPSVSGPVGEDGSAKSVSRHISAPTPGKTGSGVTPKSPPLAAQPQSSERHARRASVVNPLSPRLGGAIKQKGGRGRIDMSSPREGYEMGPIGDQRGGGVVFTAIATKEDVAMAKWRKWAVEQPLAPANTDTSPIRSRKISITTVPHVASPPSPSPPPTTSHSSTYPSPLVLSTPANARPANLARHSSEISGTPSASGSNSRTGSLPSPSPHAEASSSRSGSGQRIFESGDIFMTDSVRALQDVELAIDEDLLARTAQTRQSSRLMSIHPRVSDAENPFSDIAHRLSSRRIRPVVLELIQALGHYIHTLWCLAHPGHPCPWVMPPTEANIATPLLRGWRSRTITAVHDGRLEGFVPPPSPAQLAFWRSEVQYGLSEVDDLVGHWKKQGRVFKSALKKGYYGDVEDDNVLGSMGDGGPGHKTGGDIARLLNDLEEALWGDALPRTTDLAFVLPAGFDPYALPRPEELFSPAPSSSLADALGSPVHPSSTMSATTSTSGVATLPSPLTVLEEVYAMPDLIPPESPVDSIHAHNPQSFGLGGVASDTAGVGGTASTGKTSSVFTNQGVTQVWAQRARQSISIEGGLNEGGGTESLGEPVSLTLEQVGRKRHEEWLASRS